LSSVGRREARDVQEDDVAGRVKMCVENLLWHVAWLSKPVFSCHDVDYCGEVGMELVVL
jgi:hypothetical protein